MSGKKVIRNRAVFASRWNFGDPPVIDWWILTPNQSWHDVVRGDGCSYSPCNIDTVYQGKNESRSAFRKRVEGIAKSEGNTK